MLSDTTSVDMHADAFSREILKSYGLDSTGVRCTAEADPKQSQQADRLQNSVRSAMQVPAAIESFESQCQSNEQPVD